VRTSELWKGSHRLSRGDDRAPEHRSRAEG
jgi:hypothetical protein